MVIEPARGALNPILSDAPLIDSEAEATYAFFTPTAQRIARNVELIIAAAAGACLLTAWILSRVGTAGPLAHLFTLLAFAIAGIPALESVWEKLREFRIDVDLLMVLGAGLAAYIGSPFEGALLLFLFALSGGLETFALRRTEQAIVALRHLAPKEATVLDADRATRTPLRQVAIGARILVRPGEKIPLDGIVVAGGSSVDESAITGESIPQDRNVGDLVMAGTQNLNGRLEVQVTRHASDTTLAKIVKLVTEARHHPARAQRLIDRIGPTYSIVVMAGAVAVGLATWLLGVPGSEATRRGIAVLIVASPCALIIATPVAYLAAIAAAARSGVLIKGGAHLEVVARAGAMVFDKTGTLTTGEVQLTDIEAGHGVSESDALRFAGALEGTSNHPLAAAVGRAVSARGIRMPSVAAYDSIPGEGAKASIEGRAVWIGRPERATHYLPNGVNDVENRTQRLRGEGKTASALVIDDTVTLLGFQDTLRADTQDCLERIRSQGVKHLAMLTGDHELVARRVAEHLRLDGYLAELSPEDKLTAVEKLREKHGAVVLVGDGINDAPALAHADVGVAMGARGAEVALEAADIVLMNDRLDGLAWLHRHALRTARIVRQNLTFAIAVIVTLSVFAAMGDVPLPLAVVGHEGSTVLVSLNALRLLRR